ncbi:MAG: monovalent cation/H+ antiporter subunit E [Halapricum sp.]
MTHPPAYRLLVPIGDSVTVRATVAYVVEQAQQALEDGERVELHFVSISVGDDSEVVTDERTERLTERIEAWLQEDFGGTIPERVSVETAVLGSDRYLFSPDDYAGVLQEYATSTGIEHVVIDPEYNPEGTIPLLAPIEAELRQGDLAVVEAPVERPARQTAIARAASLSKYLATFAVALGFYLALGSPTLFDLATGAITAGIVSILLTPVAFRRTPSFGRVIRQLARMPFYAVYLLWEIVKANIAMAYVILHPSLPIDPKLVRLRPLLWGDMPVTTLANSITLTPGTLTVTVTQREYTVHSLTGPARDDLAEGALERAVRIVFYGRSAGPIPSPRERGDYEPYAKWHGDDGEPATDGSDERSTVETDTEEVNDG